MAGRIAVCLGVALLGACSLRMASPTQLDQAVRIAVVADRGRIPRTGVDLQAAVGEAIAYRAGWTIRADGAARLDLSIDKDEFSAASDNDRGIPNRWRHHISITALLVTRHGTRTWSGSGTGYAANRTEEIAASRAAAADVADQLASWLSAMPLDKPLP